MAPVNFLPKPFSRPVLFVGIAFILLFAGGYGLAYSLSYDRAASEAQLSIDHLSYILEVKDDMGLIDWSKSIEKLDDLLAYDVLINGVSKISGGNKTLVPQNLAEGLSFHFPAQWNFLWNPANKTYETVFVFESTPSPWIGGLGLSLFGLAGWFGCFIYLRGTLQKTEQPLSPLPNNKHVATEGPDLTSKTQPPPSKARSTLPYLVVNNNFNITEFSPSLTDVFTFFNPATHNFFLDLEPTEELLNRMEIREEGHVPNAFKSLKGRGATLKTLEEDLLLILEPSFEASTPQKH